ncbi:MAG: ectonucleotide pyrophosphatase/phosphodiesterase [Bacteroidales bacterium]|nr:ectonucleotide pyrophosphatase/phosphodiesterase [Bacteroidales bacterium]
MTKIKRTTAILCSCFLCAALAAQRKHSVILVTIDGMRNEMVTSDHMPSPFMKQLVEERGAMFVDSVLTVAPSMTYPTHTAIITGKTPLEHGIQSNGIFTYNRAGETRYNLYADSIKQPTLWQWVKEQGGTTASIFWPVSTASKWIDYNVPEYYAAPEENWKGGAMEYIRPVCTPEGLLAELEREATGRMTDATLRANSFEYDAKSAYMVNYLMNQYRPELTTLHLITTDYAQHAMGTEGYKVQQTVASADNAIGLIIENLEYMHLMDSTTIIVCGDHGFVQARWRLNPNVLLTQAGLLSQEPGGEWQGCFSTLGAASYLYLNPELSAKKQKKALKEMRALFENQPDSIRSLYSILDNQEIIELGGDPMAALCIDPVAGAACKNNRTGEWYGKATGGYHGYMNGCTPTCLLIYGAGAKDPHLLDGLLETGNVEAGNSGKKVMKQTSIATLVKRLLEKH